MEHLQTQPAIEALSRELAAERQRADYAWQNARTLEDARQKEMALRDALVHENTRLRTALEPFSDIGSVEVFEDACIAVRTNGTPVTHGDVCHARQLLREPQVTGAPCAR